VRLFIVAGEASGDQLGARLLADLHKLQPDIEVRGIGGAALAEEGLQSIFPMQELSLMGLAEVLPKIPNVIKRLGDTVKVIYEFQPDVVLSIDVPDFSKRLARRLQPLRQAGKIKLVHYVAPTVWAWRPGRAKITAKLFDHLLCLFPFEPPYFEKVGLPATFVGHPIAMNQPRGNAAHLREKLGIRADQPVLCLLPGSRAGEVKNLLPVFLKTFARLKQYQPDLVGLLPTLKSLNLDLGFRRDDGLHILTDPQDKWDSFALAAEQGGAIAASGTVTLELAQGACPHIIAYKVHPLTHWIVKQLYQLPFVNLINILANKLIVPEILQDDMTVQNLINAYQSVMQNPTTQKTAFAEELQKLAAEPKDAAARIITRLEGNN